MQSHFAALYARKKYLVAAFLGLLVSIAMSGKMKLNLYGIFGSKMAAP